MIATQHQIQNLEVVSQRPEVVVGEGEAEAVVEEGFLRITLTSQAVDLVVCLSMYIVCSSPKIHESSIVILNRWLLSEVSLCQYILTYLSYLLCHTLFQLSHYFFVAIYSSSDKLFL